MRFFEFGKVNVKSRVFCGKKGRPGQKKTCLSGSKCYCVVIRIDCLPAILKEQMTKNGEVDDPSNNNKQSSLFFCCVTILEKDGAFLPQNRQMIPFLMVFLYD